MAGRKNHLTGKARQGAAPLAWNPLDNAAKIFPPTSHGADSGVFRLSCQLSEPVRPELLQQALAQALSQFPHMQMVLRRGLFWYYLEQSTKVPQVVGEHAPVCSPLYYGSRSPLFEVSYWRDKVNLEIYHVLTDGSGAISFFRALLTRYLILCHPQMQMPAGAEAPAYARQEDSFQRYYEKKPGALCPAAPRRAYHLKGPRRAEGGLLALEGVAEVQRVLDAAHRHGATLTVYLCAVLFTAIRQQMYARERSRPVVLTVPVDLRGYFPSDTGRNFFGTFPVAYDFSRQDEDFDCVVRATAQAFRHTLTPQHLKKRMNQLAALEHQPFIRSVPLFIKNPIMRFAGTLSDRGETAVLSNVGRFEMPAAFTGFVRGISVFMSTHALQLCVCTYGDKLHLGFTSVFASPAVQRGFFTRLAEDGIAVEIRSNDHYLEDEECSSAPYAK